jgi:hypothetical protein
VAVAPTNPAIADSEGGRWRCLEQDGVWRSSILATGKEEAHHNGGSTAAWLRAEVTPVRDQRRAHRCRLGGQRGEGHRWEAHRGDGWTIGPPELARRQEALGGGCGRWWPALLLRPHDGLWSELRSKMSRGAHRLWLGRSAATVDAVGKSGVGATGREQLREKRRKQRRHLLRRWRQRSG